jgi:hypothetical protein
MKRIAAVLSALLLGSCATPPPQTEGAPAAVMPPQALAAATETARPAVGPAASKAAAPVAQVAVPRRRADASAQSAKPAAPPALDLKSLEQQLKDTEAIGFLTKLSLKNQVDDLLARFRSLYDGAQSAGVAQLRAPFDMLLMKVLALVQDGDPALAKSIHASREALWDVLADREKFRKLA